MSLFFFDYNSVPLVLKDKLDIMKIYLWCTQNNVSISSGSKVTGLTEQTQTDSNKIIVYRQMLIVKILFVNILYNPSDKKE